MATVTIRDLSEENHRALKARARHGRSVEAEIRHILEQAVRSEERIKVGSELAGLGRRFGGIELGLVRDPAPVDPATFE